MRKYLKLRTKLNFSNQISQIKRALRRRLPAGQSSKVGKGMKRKSLVLVSLLGGILLAAGAATAGFVGYRQYQLSQQPISYQVETTLEDSQDSFWQGNQGNISFKVSQSRQASRVVELLTVLDGTTELDSQTLTFFKTQTEHQSSIPINLSEVEEGEHRLTVQVWSAGENEERTQVASSDLTVFVDHTAPSLLEARANRGSLSRYDVQQYETAATESANTGLKLITNSTESLSINLVFSEVVRDSSTATQSALRLMPAEETPTASYTAQLSPVVAGKHQYSLADRVGNFLTGELQVVLDTQPPVIKVPTNYRVDPKTNPTTFFTFTTNEPVFNITGTLHGVTKSGEGKFPNYSIRNMPVGSSDGTLVITAQDAAGNTGRAELPVQLFETKRIPMDQFFGSKLPENVRLCTDEDKKICGYENVNDMTCDEFKVVKDCLKNRCSRSAFYLGSCPI